MAVNVSAWCIRHPVPAVMLFIVLTLAGLAGFRAMKIQNFPDIDLPTVSVTAALPGAAPAQLETEVARKIENAIATVQGVKHIYTKVQDGTATITTEFRLEKPTQQAVDEVRDAVSRIRSDLPGEMRDPVIAKMNLAGSPILTYTVASARMDDEALSWFVDNQVAKAMLAVQVVSGSAAKGSLAPPRPDGLDRRPGFTTLDLYGAPARVAITPWSLYDTGAGALPAGGPCVATAVEGWSVCTPGTAWLRPEAGS